MAMQSTRAAADAGRWEFLENTYWYVPTPYLPAVVLLNADPPRTSDVVDQTLWHITKVYNGYVIGEVATTTGNGWTYSTLVGSITPSGSVSFSFTPDSANSNVTVGHGTMEHLGGEWLFEMQMTTGSGLANITHWAYMAEVEPGDRAWNALPGYPGTGVAAAFDDDPSNDSGAAQPQRLVYGTDRNDVLAPVASKNGLLLFGEGGNDVLSGGNKIDGLVGGAGGDRLLGRVGNDDLFGQAGADRLHGGPGNDYLDGGVGNDQLIGSDGADLLSGGLGRDVLRGGAGRDCFIFTAIEPLGARRHDLVSDFARADDDRIDLRALDAKLGDAGDDAFLFRGGAAFTGQAGQLRYEASGGNTLVLGDINGDATADFAITLIGRHQLAAGDFLL